ncbi:MAG: ABC transporter ATP-binding protein [Alphaproteobacteria bacterium]|nr:ABC transporter ATP-binding protein [Alphaproteobacteria bacterium]
MTPGPALLDLEGLSAGYDGIPVVEDISLAIAPGEVISLMGRNGMGKTTLLKAAMGLIPAMRGRVGIMGVDHSRTPAHKRAAAGLGWVPEGRRIFADLTVVENLEMARRIGPWTPATVFDLFPRLAERKRHYGDTLSGGEQQMLAIGRALLTNPNVLIVDEATEGLAPKIRDEIWETFDTLRHQGLAVIVVDKHLDQLLSLCDRHFVMEKGRIVLSGGREALMADPERLHRFLGV